MPARLVPLTAGAAPIVSLQRPVVLIGRHPDCDIRINSPQISRRHCCVALAYDRLLIRDLGSRNGVRVNGRLVDESTLCAGDEVAIAQLIFRLEDQPGAVPPVAASAPKPAAQPERLSRPAELPSAPTDTDDDLVPLDDDLFPSL
jgi:pSer/pThr/pTyr-binding forkhead associated (FHA) protein